MNLNYRSSFHWNVGGLWNMNLSIQDCFVSAVLLVEPAQLAVCRSEKDGIAKQ
jgi:hypothetical protein